ncbi:MAG: hypothetical protein WCD79_06375 [Chthoniobacteraceae bacterium]
MIFSLLPLSAFAVLAIIIGTRWVVSRDNTAGKPLPVRDPPADGTTPANTPEGRYDMMRQQIISKVHWGARDGEVYDWLRERHGIIGEEADGLLADAHRTKRKAVRVKALVMLACSGCGIVFAGGVIGLQLWGHFVVVGMGSALVFVVGFSSLVAFLRNLWLLLSGKLEGSVD